MDQNKVFLKIRELGHINSKRDELQEYCKSKLDQILKCLPRRILNSDGADILDCLLNGLTDNNPTSSTKVTVKIIDIVLQSMRQEATSLTHCSDVVSRLCLELSRHSMEDLVRWSNDSVQSIIQDSDVNMIWRDILPECLSALQSHDEVKHCGTAMSTEEYKQQCVHTLCQCTWAEKQLVQLAAMFKDMQLPRADHKQVVNKVCSYMLDVPPDVLPPLVHQLLKLCRTYHVEIVLANLSHYFSVRLYSKLEPPPQDSESTTMDIDDIAPHSPIELGRCVSTCLFHCAEGAAQPELVRRVLRSWPRSQLLRAPFLLDLALASDRGSDGRSVCLDVIKSCIEQRLADEVLRTESAWARAALPPAVDAEAVLKTLTAESGNHRQLTAPGLISLGFALLGTRRAAAWSLGKMVLARLVRAQGEAAAPVLARLADRLAAEPGQTQYADCLYVLCKLTPAPVERSAALGALLEAAAAAGAAAGLRAVRPLLAFSTRTRDTLVMLCRKGLYSRDSPHRCLALSGFLTVLKYVKLSRGNFSSSQSACSEQFSCHSYLTQLTVDLHATQQGAAVSSRVRNEAMCMEVISILRRCLVQDAAVKQLLYTNIFDCVLEKTALHESILELLYEHLVKYLPDGDSGPPLLLDKCVQINGANAVLTEPIGHLLYAVSQFLQPTEEEDLEDILSSQAAETASAHLRSKLASVLDSLCTSDGLGQIDMEDPSLTDLTPESRAKCIKVQLTLQCYEALIAHRVMQWTPDSGDAAARVYSLYKACNQLLEQTKTPSKAKKGNKTLNETKETNKSQKTQSSQKKGKTPVKFSALAKDRAGPFKPPPCVWDPRFCLRLMELLYSEDVPWSSTEQRNQLRGRRDFHRWVLRGLQAGLAAPELHAPRLARLLYQRCLCRFQDMCDFDDQTTLGCIDVFKMCLTQLLSPTHSLKLESFLPIITDIPECSASVGLAAILEQVLQALTHIEEETPEEERDQTSKRLVSALVQTAALVLEARVVPCERMSGVIIKVEDYLRSSKQECLGLIPAVLAAGYRDQQEAQLLDDLLVKLATALGRVDEEDTSAGEESTSFPSVDSRSGHAALGSVCAALAQRARVADLLLLRAKDHALALERAPGAHVQRIDRELTDLYKSIVLQLCQLTVWTTRAAQLRCCVGGGSDRLLAACVRLYSLLARLARQLPPARAQGLRLERLLKLSGKKFSNVCDNLITYLEASQQQRRASRVLRDTKLIPRLVLEAEQFSKHVMLLAGKAKLNLQQYLSLGTARDFRIRAPLLQEALNAGPPPAGDNQDDGDDDEIHDASTDLLSPAASEAEDASDEETTRKKRRRVS